MPIISGVFGLLVRLVVILTMPHTIMTIHVKNPIIPSFPLPDSKALTIPAAHDWKPTINDKTINRLIVKSSWTLE